MKDSWIQGIKAILLLSLIAFSTSVIATESDKKPAFIDYMVNRYHFEKALQDVDGWKKLKAQSVTDNEKSILKYIFEHF